MDWNLAIEDDRQALKRIVAVLFALAGLAERLSGLPRPVRAFVLRILGSAETVARDFVLETPRDDAASRPGLAALHSDSPADAMRLARSFRLLAVLADMLADRDCGRGKPILTPTSGAMISRVLAAMRREWRQPFPATVRLAVERRDSS